MRIEYRSTNSGEDTIVLVETPDGTTWNASPVTRDLFRQFFAVRKGECPLWEGIDEHPSSSPCYGRLLAYVSDRDGRVIVDVDALRKRADALFGEGTAIVRGMDMECFPTVEAVRMVRRLTDDERREKPHFDCVVESDGVRSLSNTETHYL